LCLAPNYSIADDKPPPPIREFDLQTIETLGARCSSRTARLGGDRSLFAAHPSGAGANKFHGWIVELVAWA